MADGNSSSSHCTSSPIRRATPPVWDKVVPHQTEKVFEPSADRHPSLQRLFHGRPNPYVRVQKRTTIAFMLEQEEDQAREHAQEEGETAVVVKMEVD